MFKLCNRLLLIVFLFTSAPVILSAQSDWLDGFIVKLDGDTVKGKVGYFTDNTQYGQCLFKEDKKARSYTPSNILSYGIDNMKTYSSQVVKDKFVEIVATGFVSLYRENKTLLVQTEGGEVYPLNAKQQRVTKDGIEYLSQTKKWKSVFFGIVSSCGVTANDIKKLSLNEKNILSQIRKYNECKGGDTEVYRNKKFQKVLVDYGVLLGRRNSELDISSVDGILRLVDGSYKSSDYIVGALIDFRFPNLSDRVSLELGINHQSSLVLRKFLGSTSSIVFREIVNSLSLVSIPISLKIVIKEGKIPLFIQPGITFQRYYKTSSTLYIDRITPNGIDLREQNRPFDIDKGKSYPWTRLGLSKSFKGQFKLTLAFDVVFSSSGLLKNLDKFSPFNQSGISLIISK